MSKQKDDRRIILTDDERIGNVCVSLAGHDAGLIFIVVGAAGDDYVYLADGKTRKLSAPKLKKTKHISIITRLSQENREKISGRTANDSLLRREIARVTREMLN